MRSMKSEKAAIKDKVSKILEIFSFKNMRAKHLNFCPCYKTKPCHSLKNMNCFFCFCPEYSEIKKNGKCSIKSNKGKWFFNKNLSKGKIWDCSDCNYPHKKENARKMLTKIFSS